MVNIACLVFWDFRVVNDRGKHCVPWFFGDCRVVKDCAISNFSLPLFRRRTLKASPKFTTQISILGFVPSSKVFSAKFAKSSLFACTRGCRTHSVGLGPTGMKPLRPLGGVDCDRNRRPRLLKKQPVQTLYGFSNQIVPRACFPDGIRVSNLPGVQLIDKAVQSLYGLVLGEKRSLLTNAH